MRIIKAYYDRRYISEFLKQVEGPKKFRVDHTAPDQATLDNQFILVVDVLLPL
jgi:hypothetical protein